MKSADTDRRYLEGDSHLTDQVGTCYYVAPEVLAKDYTEASDLWSVGVVIYIMLTGMTPFGGDSSQDIMKQVRETPRGADWDWDWHVVGKLNTDPLCAQVMSQTRDPAGLALRFETEMAECGLTELCRQFVLGLLTVDPKERFTASTALQHEWFRSTEDGAGR